MHHDNAHLYVLILAGGSGTRLWPASRKKTPKHLLQLNSNLSMIQETVERVRDMVPENHIFVVTKVDQKNMVLEQLPFLPNNHVVAEPSGKNTAWAMGLGAYYIAYEDPEAVIINLAADHVIADKNRFQKAVLAAALEAAKRTHLLTVGIVPNSPHTGYGYIRIGKQCNQITGLPVYEVVSFTEKPDKETAEQFIATKEYFWNANLYTWHVAALKQALKAHSPHVYEGLKKVARDIGTPREQTTLADVYQYAQDTQIDKGVSEKAGNLLMIPGNFGWNDIGDWSVLYDIKATKPGQNIVIGENVEHIGIKTHGTLIESNGRMIATIGLEDIVIIDTRDALLVCAKDKVQDVKKVVEKLKIDGNDKYL